MFYILNVLNIPTPWKDVFSVTNLLWKHRVKIQLEKKDLVVKHWRKYLTCVRGKIDCSYQFLYSLMVYNNCL